MTEITDQLTDVESHGTCPACLSRIRAGAATGRIVEATYAYNCIGLSYIVQCQECGWVDEGHAFNEVEGLSPMYKYNTSIWHPARVGDPPIEVGDMVSVNIEYGLEW